MVEDEGQDVGVRQVIPGAPECSEPGCAGPTRGRGPWVLSRSQWSLSSGATAERTGPPQKMLAL